MQKVVGSSPIIRSKKSLQNAGSVIWKDNPASLMVTWANTAARLAYVDAVVALARDSTR